MQPLKSSLKFLTTFIAAFAVVSNAAPDLVLLAPVGNIATTVLPRAGYTEYYYQNSTGSIVVDIVTGPFTSSGSTTTSNLLLVPSDQVKRGTPIAACSSSNSTGDGWNDVHLFFYSPDNLLSEYYYTPATNWQSGPNCTACITQSGFFGANGSHVLYAFENGPEGTIRVGFISAGSPQTLSEAIKEPNQAWVVATIPN